MPIYEFQCQTCGCEFEKVRSFSDSTMPACPKCASVDVQRQLSRPAIHFKGSGWYINDSKNNNKASTPAGADKESGETKSTDAKPEGEKAADSKEPSKEVPKETTTKAVESTTAAKTESSAKS